MKKRIVTSFSRFQGPSGVVSRGESDSVEGCRNYCRKEEGSDPQIQYFRWNKEEEQCQCLNTDMPKVYEWKGSYISGVTRCGQQTPTTNTKFLMVVKDKASVLSLDKLHDYDRNCPPQQPCESLNSKESPVDSNRSVRENPALITIQGR